MARERELVRAATYRAVLIRVLGFPQHENKNTGDRTVSSARNTRPKTIKREVSGIDRRHMSARALFFRIKLGKRIVRWPRFEIPSSSLSILA